MNIKNIKKVKIKYGFKIKNFTYIVRKFVLDLLLRKFIKALYF